MKFCMLHPTSYEPSKVTALRVDRYCSLHRHTFVRRLGTRTAEGWEIVSFIQDQLKDPYFTGWVVWCDPSVLFLREDIDLNDFLPDSKDVVFMDLGDGLGLSTALMAFRCASSSQELLDRCQKTRNLGLVGFGHHRTLRDALRGVVESDLFLKGKTARFPTSFIQGPKAPYSETAFAVDLRTPDKHPRESENLQLILEKGWTSAIWTLARTK